MKVKGLKKEIDAGYARFLAKRQQAVGIVHLNFRQQMAAGAKEAKARKEQKRV